ncbi:LysR family transcriptional regulator [Streptacidiphilus sp. EB103A]|uniref:LysR family transcriptional regulator n=1 Tax=Streptacidiphilus sp. EB103A TaxID=3156275 RepID=UPI00351341D6
MPLSITVRQVEAFLAVCEEQHFSRAAARLCVSPPWLSQTIKELERHVGVRLLERTTRSVVLTEAGTVFASLAGRALSDLDNAVATTRSLARADTQSLSLGYTIGAGLEILPRLVRTFAAQYPEVHVATVEFDFADPSAGLRDRKVDAAVVRPPIGLAGLASLDLLAEPRVACLPEGHRLAGRASLQVADVLTEPIIAAPASPGPWRDYWLLTEYRATAAPVVAEASTFEAELHMVARGEGISITATSASRWYTRPGIVFIPIDDLEPCRVALAWWPEDTPLVAGLVSVATHLAGAN